MGFFKDMNQTHADEGGHAMEKASKQMALRTGKWGWDLG
jgi:hypothetical protein